MSRRLDGVRVGDVVTWPTPEQVEGLSREDLRVMFSGLPPAIDQEKVAVLRRISDRMAEFSKGDSQPRISVMPERSTPQSLGTNAEVQPRKTLKTRKVEPAPEPLSNLDFLAQLKS
ncbi:MAG: hypothetical protein U0984_07550 [Prosthecobacter sp.]|nr:hypothetical protein [Prosthecobacter sp.]